MPTYEYLCKKCDKRFDVVQSFKDDALTECLCPEKGEVRKVYGAVGIAFKGSGFYKNDARGSKASTIPSSGGSSGSSDSSSSSGGSSDSGSSTPAKSSDGGGSATPAAAPSTSA